MNRQLEQQVLDLARERGLIGDDDLAVSVEADGAVRRWGRRLGVLVASGALDEAELAVLVGELTGGAPAEDDEPALMGSCP